jgi:uncharacterized FlgJ-related protein
MLQAQFVFSTEFILNLAIIITIIIIIIIITTTVSGRNTDQQSTKKMNLVANETKSSVCEDCCRLGYDAV